MSTSELLSLGVQVVSMVVVAVGIIFSQRPVLLSIIRDTMHQVLKDYTRKEEEQLRWESHFREVQEVRRRYDEDIVEIRRRLTALEEHVNLDCRKSP